MPAKCCKERWERLLQEDPDMPVFTILAKDAFAVSVVKFWMEKAEEAGVNPEKMIKVQEHLEALEDFAQNNPHKMKIPD